MPLTSVRALLDQETLEQDEAYAAAGISPDTAPAAIPPPRQGNQRFPGLAPRPVRMKDPYFPNEPWCFGPVRQTADMTGASTGRARIWLSAAASAARGSPLPAGDRQAMNRSGRTRIAPSLAIWRWRSQAQRGSW